MSRVVVIGGSGHIGSYLTPRLVHAGYEVVCVSRSKRQPYFAHDAWAKVERAYLDRQAEEESGAFGTKIAKLNPDAVIDLTCYTLESAQQLVEGVRGRVQHFIHCGTIWVHGPSFDVPTTEDQPRYPIDDYGRRKAAIEDYLLTETLRNGFPATILHPGHLVGQGWLPLNPAANFNSQVFSDLASGKPIILPSAGEETVHHVHADDVAQAFVNALG
jgi:nucleoside-diphosphate-sugar epimerase